MLSACLLWVFPNNLVNALLVLKKQAVYVVGNENQTGQKIFIACFCFLGFLNRKCFFQVLLGLLKLFFYLLSEVNFRYAAKVSHGNYRSDIFIFLTSSVGQIPCIFFYFM